MVYILTGDTESGKSYALNEWIKSKTNVAGLLSLNNDKGKRYFLDIRNEETFSMHPDENESEVNKIFVGRFTFLKSSFERANNIIQYETKQTDYEYLIVDELGRLELKQKGLYKSTNSLVKLFKNNKEKHLILVVRTALLEKIKNYYHINPHQILHRDDLNSI